MQARRNAGGFTLVELSIVLLLMGLLSAVVMVGQELTVAAEVRNSAANIRQTQAMVNIFKDRFGYMPGDFPNATEYWTQNPNGTAMQNGNGDNILNADPWPWYHLIAAEIMTEYPEFSGVLQYQEWQFYNYTVQANQSGYFIVINSWDFVGSMKPGRARMLDSKIDNGSALDGWVVPACVIAFGDDLPETSCFNCTTQTATPEYNIERADKVCNLAIEMGEKPLAPIAMAWTTGA